MKQATGWQTGAARRACSCRPLLVALVLSFAGPAAQAVEPDEAAEHRLRIAQQRSEADAAWQSRRAACDRRFAVTACIEAANADHRQQIDAIERELDRLDTQQRRQRAAERLEIIRRKSENLAASAAASGDLGGAGMASPADMAVAPVPARPPPSVDSEIERRRAAAAREAAERARAARERHAEAERRRVEREQRRPANRSGAATLPVPKTVPPPAASSPAR